MIRVYQIVIWHWKSHQHHVVNVLLGRLEQIGNVTVLLHLVVFILDPSMNVGAVPLDHNEVCIE